MSDRRCANPDCRQQLAGRTRRARYCNTACRAHAWKTRTGYGATTRIKEIPLCRPTTSAPTFPSAAANGAASLSSPLIFTICPPPAPVTTRPSSSSASNRRSPTAAPVQPINRLQPIAPVTLSWAAPEHAETELLEISQRLEAGRVRRARRGGVRPCVPLPGLQPVHPQPPRPVPALRLRPQPRLGGR